MTSVARWGVLVLLLTPVGTWALGLGNIELRSALNQPLDAEIQLVSATTEELSSLRVNLASQETFDRYGLDRPAYLAGITFAVGTDSLGRPMVSVSSSGPIAEPFVTVLVEASWSRGRLLREYTVLLDPPVLLPLPAAAPSVQPAQTGAPDASQPAAAINRPAAQLAPAPATRVAQPVAPVQAATPSPGSYGPVRSAETLWAIAEQYRPNGVTMNQMMVAVYRANLQAFGGNMNTLHLGSILRIPQLAELNEATAAAATEEVLRQAADWQTGTDTQARLRLVTPESADNADIATGGSTAAATTDVAALEGELGTALNELSESQRLLEIRDQQLQDLQAQLAAAQDAAVGAEPEPLAETGVDLESEPLFADEEPPIPAATPVVEEPAVVTPPAAVTRVVAPPIQPSLLSRVLGWLTSPILLIGLGVLALLGTAVWYLRYRQQDTDDVTGRWEALEADLGDDTDSIEATARLREQVDTEATINIDEQSVVVEEPEAAFEPLLEPLSEPLATSAAETPPWPDSESDTSDAPSGEPLTIGIPPEEESKEDTISSQTIINLEQADPVAEADFHMAYGLYDQAAELVEKGLEAEPGRRDLRLKLLEVFFVWGNKDSFLQTAQVLRTEMGDESDSDWDKVVIMGKQICPDESLFSAVTASAGAVDVDVDLDASDGDAPALDLAFDADDGAGVDLDIGDFSAPDLEFQLEASGTQEAIEEELDLGAQTAAGLEAALFDSSDDASDEPIAALETDSLEATQESPTIETPISPTVETPDFDSERTDTADAMLPDSPTAESPTLETALESTGELPTVEQPAISEDARDPNDRTAEIDLDDLGLDIEDLADLTGDLGVLPEPADLDIDAATAADGNVLSSTDVSEVLEKEDDAEPISDDDATLLAPGTDDASLLALGDQDATMLAPDLGDDLGGGTQRMGQSPVEDPSLDDSPADVSADAGSGIDLDLDDLTSALEESDTVEQPMAQSVGSDLSAGIDSTDVSLGTGSEAPTGDATGTAGASLLDPHTMTMTEVGTKLDLARAYMDMGDPDGARSILEEVLEEGDDGQQKEAQGIIDTL